MASIHKALGALAAVAAGVHQNMGYGGLGGLGRAPSRRGGRAKNLRNLPASLREQAKADAKAVRDSIKSANAQAWADFYAKYPGAIPVETRKIDRVVAMFLHGRTDVTTSPHVQSEGSGSSAVLRVQGREVARMQDDRFIKVCPGDFGVGRADRTAANSVLRMLRAGLHATDRDGKVYLAPTGHQGRVVAESCMLVEVNSKVRAAARKYASGAYLSQKERDTADLEAYYATRGAQRAAYEAEPEWTSPRNL